MVAANLLSAGHFVELFRDGLPRSISTLAADTGLSRSTIKQRIGDLESIGLVAPDLGGVSTGGRPAAQYRLQPENWPVIGIDLGASHCDVGILDLMGNVLVSSAAPIDIADGPVVVLDQAVAQVNQLLAERGPDAAPPVAVGIGLPGPVEHATGRPIDPPIMPGWHGFDVAEYLHQKLGIPVLVDNDANIAALGERTVAWPEASVLLYVKVATGIGAGIVSNGTLQRGSNGTAGDIGHVRVDAASGQICRCGNIDCLESIASGTAMVRDARAAGREIASISEFAALANSGDALATRRLRQAGRVIGEVLTMCVSLINPAVIVIDGELALSGDHLLNGIREVVYSQAMPLATRDLQIVRSNTGGNASLVGAGILAAEHVLSVPAIENRVAQLPGHGN